MYIICFLLLIILLSVQNSVIGLHWADLFSCSIKYSVNCYFILFYVVTHKNSFPSEKKTDPDFKFLEPVTL